MGKEGCTFQLARLCSVVERAREIAVESPFVAFDKLLLLGKR